MKRTTKKETVKESVKEHRIVQRWIAKERSPKTDAGGPAVVRYIRINLVFAGTTGYEQPAAECRKMNIRQRLLNLHDWR